MAHGDVAGIASRQVRTLFIREDLAGAGYRCSTTGVWCSSKDECRDEGAPRPVRDIVDEAIEEALSQGVRVDGGARYARGRRHRRHGRNPAVQVRKWFMPLAGSPAAEQKAEAAHMEKIRIEQHGFAGTLWFGACSSLSVCFTSTWGRASSRSYCGLITSAPASARYCNTERWTWARSSRRRRSHVRG